MYKHFESKKAYDTAEANRKKRNSGKLNKLAQEREALLDEIKKGKAEHDEELRQQALEKISSGEISIYSATGLTEAEIAELTSGNQRALARRKLLPKAFAVVDGAMSSYDEKVALAGAKLAIDLCAQTPEELEALQRAQKVAVKRIERRVIDVTG